MNKNGKGGFDANMFTFFESNNLYKLHNYLAAARQFFCWNLRKGSRKDGISAGDRAGEEGG